MPPTDEQHLDWYAEVEIPPYIRKDAASVVKAATIAGVQVFYNDGKNVLFYLPLQEEKQNRETLLARVQDALGLLDIPAHVLIKMTAEATV
ncbi:MAG: hypothetical protein A2804_03555 [Candidatus Pacebacteria bacterium RIFCSPHIGHO2_01_FULL_46_10]|nr:MAG: hypothetical protein A2804_03555 [Candidatus Pacebacteria bacterium RIFCSPHIGHO2_01_FULL_46_10]